MSHRLRLAVVGLGVISQSVHLPLIGRLRELFELVALADLSAERTATIGARYGIPFKRQYRTVTDLISGIDAGLQVDAVLLATGGSHGADLLALSRAGFPVLCEKPVAFTIAEVDVIEDEVRRQHRDVDSAVLVGYMKEHDPAVARAREELAGKVLRAVTVEVLHPADAAQLEFTSLLPAPTDVEAGVVDEFDAGLEMLIDEAVGGDLPAEMRKLYSNVVLGSIIHDISLLRHLAGGITAVDYATHTGVVPGSLQMVGSLAGGVPLHLGWYFISDYPDYRETVTFHHDQGTVELVFSVPYILNIATELRVTARREGGGVAHSCSRWSQQEAFENELIAFHAMVTEGSRPHSGLDEGRADLRAGQLLIAALGRSQGTSVGGEAAEQAD